MIKPAYKRAVIEALKAFADQESQALLFMHRGNADFELNQTATELLPLPVTFTLPYSKSPTLFTLNEVLNGVMGRPEGKREVLVDASFGKKLLFKYRENLMDGVHVFVISEDFTSDDKANEFTWKNMQVVRQQLTDNHPDHDQQFSTAWEKVWLVANRLLTPDNAMLAVANDGYQFEVLQSYNFPQSTDVIPEMTDDSTSMQFSRLISFPIRNSSTLAREYPEQQSIHADETTIPCKHLIILSWADSYHHRCFLFLSRKTIPWDKSELRHISRINELAELIVGQSAELNIKNELYAELSATYAKLTKESQAKDEFLSMMNHEVRTPLSHIVGFTELLDHGLKNFDPIQLQEMIHIIHRSSKHLMSLINNTTDLAKIKSGKVVLNIDEHELLPLLSELVDEFSQCAVEKGIQIHCKFDKNLSPRILVDTVRLNQIITNMLDNALKYNKTGKNISLSIEHSDKYTRLNIDDDGDAIPEKYHSTLFEAQNRAGKELSTDPGSGLGLSISKNLAELMHGQIGYRALPAGGNRFWVDFLNTPVPKESESFSEEAVPTKSSLR